MAERSWLRHVAAQLDVDPDVPDDALLDVARVVAHSVERKMTPLTTYLIGVAAGRRGVSADVEDLCRRVMSEARSWDGGGSADADGSGG